MMLNKNSIFLFICFISVSLCINNFLTDSWISIVISGIANAPESVSLHTASINLLNNTMVIFGGKNSQHIPNNMLTKYDLIEDSWIPQSISNYTTNSPPGSIPSPRYGHVSLTTLDNKMFVYGGRDQSQVFDDIYKYDMETDLWELIEVTGFKTKRWGHSGAIYAVGDELYFYGGASTINRESLYLSDLVKFNFKDNTWETVNIGSSKEFAPPALFLHSSILFGSEKIVLFGGKKIVNSTNSVSNQIYIFTAEAGQWLNVTLNSTSSFPIAKFGHTAVLTPLNTMLVFAGNDSSSIASSSVQRFDFKYNKWDYVSPSGEGPASRSGHTSITTPFNTMITFGGQSSGTHYLNDLYKYNIINSVLRSASDGTVLVVLLSLVGAMIIGLCFALDIISERNEIARYELLEKDAIAKNNEIALKNIMKEKKDKQLQPLFEKF